MSLASVAGFAQPPDTMWTRVLTEPYEDYCFDIQQTTDTGYLVAGWGSTPQGTTATITKLLINGEVDWSRSYRDYGLRTASAVIEMENGSFILTGSGEPPSGGTSPMIAKFTSTGDTMWTRVLDVSPEAGRAICRANDTTFVIAAGDGATMWPDVLLIKATTNGDTIWSKQYGGPSIDIVRDLKQTADGGFILVGSTVRPGSPFFRLWLIRVDDHGDTLWTRTVSSDSSYFGESVEVCADGGYVAVGQAVYEVEPPEEYCLVTRFDATGNVLWLRTYGGMGSLGRGICKAAHEGYVITGGVSGAPDAYPDLFVFRIAENGDSLWAVRVGGTNSDLGTVVRRTAEGGYIVGGYTLSHDYPDPLPFVVSLAADCLAVMTNAERWPNAFEMCLFPNPCNSSAVLEFSIDTHRLGQVEIRNSLGQLVSTYPVTPSVSAIRRYYLDVSRLSSGSYFIIVRYGGLFSTRRLVVLR